MAKIDIHQIDFDRPYVGYIWMSDAMNPIVLQHDKFDEQLMNDGNHFIVEAMLYDDDAKKSYYMKWHDGCCHVFQYDVESSDMNNATCYLSHRMNDRQLLFSQRWEEVDNEDNWKVLQPAGIVFLGFKE